jgi:hypothetical protein
VQKDLADIDKFQFNYCEREGQTFIHKRNALDFGNTKSKQNVIKTQSATVNLINSLLVNVILQKHPK